MRSAAFETSAPTGGVAIGDGALLRVARIAERNQHARLLLPELDRLLREAGWERRSLERLVVDIGPGSFTGLRIGLATAKTLAVALECALVGVSAFDAWAAALPADTPGPLALVMDARRESVYLRRYPDGPGAPAAGPFETRPAAELDLDGWTLAGSGAEAYWPDAPRLALPDAPDAGALLALADARGVSLDPLHASPEYGMSGVRPPRT